MKYFALFFFTHSDGTKVELSKFFRYHVNADLWIEDLLDRFPDVDATYDICELAGEME